jgi:Ca-activated chloride channel family protein
MKLLCTTLLLFTFLTAHAQILIKGRVTETDGTTGIPGATIIVKGSNQGTISSVDGFYNITVPDQKAILVFSFIGYVSKEVKVGYDSVIDVSLVPEPDNLEEIIVTGYGLEKKRLFSKRRNNSQAQSVVSFGSPEPEQESYDKIEEAAFTSPARKPLSTFSIDVDAASYSNMRRFLMNGQNPPADAVRIEEMINYFNYSYKAPEGIHPFSIESEIGICPWNSEHRLVHIGLQGQKIDVADLPPNNLVFLLDVSGSMDSPDKLPLLQNGLKLLVKQMRPEDRVSIVVYAGAAGLVLPSTSGKEKDKILDALANLQAGGSTAGGQGIRLAYKVAQENFKKNGNNRIILATDGDFNVGLSSDEAMIELIEEKRESGVFLTCLGFGTGNYKDSKMEKLADKGNGNYAYIDNILEAKKVLVKEMGATLLTIAKDVKIQVEFNPSKVQAYRLIGYENRQLKDEDFEDDTKDAGELGAGHTVTALYEVIPVGVKNGFTKNLPKLKYSSTKLNSGYEEELFTVKFRYKQPKEKDSQLIELAVEDQNLGLEETSNNFRFSAAVAAFGMLLRDSEFKGEATYEKVTEWARTGKGEDVNGYRAEFIKLTELAVDLQ